MIKHSIASNPYFSYFPWVLFTTIQNHCNKFNTELPHQEVFARVNDVLANVYYVHSTTRTYCYFPLLPRQL